MTDASPGAPAVEVRALVKSYGGRRAVAGIDLSVRRGEVFALLGPNGAGKTTTVEVLEGYRRRDSGEVSVLGHDPGRHERELKGRIGIVLQHTGIDTFLTAAETVHLLGAAYPRRLDVDEVLAMVGLADVKDIRVAKLSGGQRRRLDVAVAVAGDPDLLFLDEPTTGFDPAARRSAWELVKALAQRGKTIFLTTHYMEEAQYLADRVAIMARGTIVATGPPSTLDPGVAKAVIRFRIPVGVPGLPDPLAAQAAYRDDQVELSTDDPTRVLFELTGWAVEQGLRLEGLSVSRPSLEDVYLELTRPDGETEIRA